MELNELNNPKETVKNYYVKPAMEVYEMELEEGVLLGASGDDIGDGGGVDRPQPTNSGLPWEKYTTKHGL